jgi:uncharacterized protein (DUF305 family)
VSFVALNESLDDNKLLPWWKNPLNIVLMLAIVVFVAVGIGYNVGKKSSALSHNEVDTGFLQDMRIHHEQAVAMSSIYLAISPDGNNTLRQIARQIMLDQSMEAGRMVQMLRMFKEAETNESDQVMSWMGTPIPLAKMPGYATDAEMKKLSKTQGVDADKTFARLMIAHHKGAIHMAEFAAQEAINTEVVAFARSILKAQQGEINELSRIAGV